MRPVQIPCRFFRQVIDSAYLCRTCIDDSKILCCLFIIIYDIIVILSVAKNPEGDGRVYQAILFGFLTPTLGDADREPDATL
ncbi:MAG TPA: hypothetical protein VMF56_03835, partial [Acidobacteriaceae bacterium]|nr:hypothetical protein [Acidobacteriaceae bacterium]